MSLARVGNLHGNLCIVIIDVFPRRIRVIFRNLHTIGIIINNTLIKCDNSAP